MFDFNSLNLSEVKVDDYSPLPVGEYEAIIDAFKIENNKNCNGVNAIITYRITSQGYQNRQLKQWLVLSNPNQKTVEIAKQKLVKLINAIDPVGGVGKANANGEAFFVNQIIGLKLSIKPAEGNFSASNNVDYVFSLKDRKPQAPKPADLPQDADIPF
jgi:hypothetical protein